jgi:glycosyltransferase involved in cell wall biosynthesis
MAPGAVAQYLSQSKTVALREGYFPPSVTPRIVNLPGHLPPAPRNDEADTYLFTASRLDGPKRLDLLIDAMAHVPGDIELRIAGTGALRPQLEAQAAGDPHIRFLGFTRNDLLPELYANALAVPFIPADEDLGLITLEAFSQGTAVVTCTDSGGPTEFIKDGVTGLVAEPNAASIGGKLASLVADPELAHRLGQAGKERGERITWEEVVEALLGDERFTPEELAARAAAAGDAAEGATAVRSRRRVVVLSTFPINDPGHGGQLRARNLYGALSRVRPVEVIALVDFGHQPSVQRLDANLTQVVIPRSAAHHRKGQELSIEARVPVTDVVAGEFIDLTPAYLDAVAEAADGASAIILAEPYLLGAVAELDLDLPVIYDAYNVEATLKAGAFPDTKLGRELLAQVEMIEERAVEWSARTTTCSQADADALFAALGPAAAVGPEHFTVIPNGTSIPDDVVAPEERAALSARWRHRYWTAGSTGAEPEHLAVFFGSWHPPNLDAVDLLIEVAAELPSTLILSVGFHGQAFLNRIVPPNLVFPGMVTTRTKDRLLRAADVALNPMRLGSGTNLKLLEYLAVGVPVVSTPFGTRGIDVVDGEHLRLAEPDAFAAVVAEVLADPVAAHARARAARALVSERYAWSALASDLATVVSEIVPAEVRR